MDALFKDTGQCIGTIAPAMKKDLSNYSARHSDEGGFFVSERSTEKDDAFVAKTIECVERCVIFSLVGPQYVSARR